MKPGIYGVMGRFSTPDDLLDAILAMRRTDPHIRLEVYTPYAVEGLAEALDLPPSRIPRLTLIGGMLGALGGYFMQWYATVVSFPQNIGGRPLNSWPMFIPVTFEMAILGAALAAVFGMLFLNGLPRLYHPVFNTPCFDLASRDRYFLCIRPQGDPTQRFDVAYYRQALSQLGAVDTDEIRP